MATMPTTQSQLVRWFDLSRFSAALKVVPISPLRGIPMTCLEVRDSVAFTTLVRGAELDALGAGEAQRRSEAWWERMSALGFTNKAEFFERTDSSNGNAFRLYSDRSTFTLSEMQSIVPGVVAEDLKPLPIAEIVLERGGTDPDVQADWKRFAQEVLSKEAVGVWAPKVNPFDVAYADARAVEKAWYEATRVDRSPLFKSDPCTKWFGTEMDKARYRENALTAFYADLEAVQAAGLTADAVEQVDLPYALPLWVEKTGRIVAVRDVRHIPELMSVPPQNYFGSVEHEASGLAVKLLRAARPVEAVYREEVGKWSEWIVAARAGENVDADALATSLRRVIEADRDLCAEFSAIPNTHGADDLDSLLDGDKWKAGGAVRNMRPLGEWSATEFMVLVARSRRYLQDGSPANLFEGMLALDERVRSQAAERAKAAARDALRQVAASVQQDATVVISSAEHGEKVRHEDAGIKIGGARKDYYRRAMTTDDLEGMSDFERGSLVVKKNVWPPLDYAAMREAGVTPEAAIAIKYIKDSLNVEPGHGRVDHVGSGYEAEYIKAIGVVRDVMESVQTIEQFKEGCRKLYDIGRRDPDGIPTTYIAGGTAMQVQWGRDTASLVFDGNDGNLPARVSREIRRKVHEGNEWGALIKPSRVKSDDEKAADAERTDQEQVLHRPHLESVQRTGGAEWRGDGVGRDIVAQDLIEHFGFAGVEFGEWLPQDERQAVLNMAFDSLCDLSDALGLPPKAISFDGELSVAFGSRGTGGRNAALAHFEPGRNVINLTRMKGAGTLAHEWFHALDWNLGGKTAFLTTTRRARYTGDPMPKLIERLKRRASSPEEIATLAGENANKGRSYAVSWLWEQSPEAKAVLAVAMDELVGRGRAKLYAEASSRFGGLKENEKSLASLARGLHPEGAAASAHAQLAEEIVEALRTQCDNSKAFTKVRSKVEGNVAWMVANLGRLATIDAARDHGVTLDDRFLGGGNSRETTFYVQGKALDKKRSKAYWSTDVELLARAGAQFVHYELEANGVRSDYLVYGAEEERHANHPMGNPNPTDIDRLALREHFTALIEDYRVRLARTMEEEVGVEP